MKKNDIVKIIASKIGLGICYGVGISIAVIAIVYGYEKFDSEKSEYEKYEYADDKDKSSLVIKEHELVINNENLVEIIGSVQNNSKFEWSGVKIEIELFDEDGKFVYECNDTITAKISPSQSENFKVECSSCNKSIPSFTKYEIKIVDSFGRKLKK